jgi:hypothetical protein
MAKATKRNTNHRGAPGNKTTLTALPNLTAYPRLPNNPTLSHYPALSILPYLTRYRNLPSFTRFPYLCTLPCPMQYPCQNNYKGTPGPITYPTLGTTYIGSSSLLQITTDHNRDLSPCKTRAKLITRAAMTNPKGQTRTDCTRKAKGPRVAVPLAQGPFSPREPPCGGPGRQSNSPRTWREPCKSHPCHPSPAWP